MRVRFATSCWLVAAGTLAGCGGSESTTSPTGREASAACAPLITYDDRRYVGAAVRVEPAPGRDLGIGTRPWCADTPDAPERPPEEIEIAEIVDVPPAIAIAVRTHSGTVYIRDDVDRERLPQELERLLQAPRCLAVDEPIELTGPWRGILGADGHTELDLVPPYDVDLFAESSSAARYARAHLTVRVPSRLGRPLDREDIERSLWEGGTISIRAHCEDAAFVADRVDARPPTG